MSELERYNVDENGAYAAENGFWVTADKALDEIARLRAEVARQDDIIGKMTAYAVRLEPDEEQGWHAISRVDSDESAWGCDEAAAIEAWINEFVGAS